MPGWPMPPRGDRIGQTSHPINELQARTNEDKGKDGQGWIMGKDGQGQIMGKDGQGRARTGKDGQGWASTGKDGQGQRWAGTNGAGYQLVRVSPRLGCTDEKGTITV